MGGAVKEDVTNHVRRILDLLDADNGEAAYEYAQKIPADEASVVIQGLRNIADAVTLAVFPDSAESALLNLKAGWCHCEVCSGTQSRYNQD